MKKETVSVRRKVIAGGLFAALCAIVCMAISVPAMANPRMSSERSTSDAPKAQQPATGTIAGHEYVDLGLSVKWATCNVGASSPSEYGDYFAWGEISPKSTYAEENSKTCGTSFGDIAGNSQYDAARANWGGSWRMPTKAEMQELIDKCTWTWTIQGGHNGCRVTSKINGNSIFLPAAGIRNDSLLGFESECGGYWSSTPCEDDTYAYVLCFGSDDNAVDEIYRYGGFSVRPVFCESVNSDSEQDSLVGEKSNQNGASTIAGHEYVDLGLSVKWATCNVGASSPEEYGDYFAWGEIAPKSEYTKENSKTCGKNFGDIAGNPQYDAARANWDGSWRLPTKAEMQELVNNCTWTWTTQGGHNGYKVTSKINGNSIFILAAGVRSGSSLYYESERGYYWCSSPYENDTQNAYILGLASGGRGGMGWDGRGLGLNIRPVFCESANNDREHRGAEQSQLAGEKSKQNGVAEQPRSTGGNSKQKDYAKAKPATGTAAGHDWVDLGLSVKWATCNVGASSPSEYGDYFAWGETTTEAGYTQGNSKTYGKNLGDIVGNSQYDAARANWGLSWRLPTEAEMRELVSKCTWTWTTQGGNDGYKITSKINGNSIFLPAAGWRDGSSLQLDAYTGSYWCSAPNKRKTHHAYDLYFISGDLSDTPGVGCDCRFFGQSVRPVLCESANNDNEQARLDEDESEQEEVAKPKLASGTIAGHEYVDLGLSVKWATCNVGASSPAEYGDYFAWGETMPKSEYTEENCKTRKKKYIGDIAGNPQYDAARANWGGSWRMPTAVEMQELIDNCTWVTTAQGGHNGYKVTSKINGNSIFIPASGWYCRTIYGNVRVTGSYWCSTPDDSDIAWEAYSFGFNISDQFSLGQRQRYYGQVIRPVTE